MEISTARAQADWDLGKLVHDLDLQSASRMRERIAALDLTVAQASALRELDQPLAIGQLAARMSCEPSNATAVIDRLERAELVERRAHPTDRRAKRLHLSEAGESRRAEILAVLARGELITGLTLDERRELERLLRRALAEPGVSAAR